jgi:adhesin transport system membrane fusion protein
MKFFWFLKGSGARIDPARDALESELLGFRKTTWVAMGALGIFLIWASIAELDEVTRAPGSVIASSRTQIIQSQDGGVLQDLLVKEGDVVEADQILARLETTRAETSFLEARARAAGLGATAARLQAEIFGGEPKFPNSTRDYPEFRRNQTDLFFKRQSAINEEIAALEAVLKLVRQELEMLTPLLKTGDVSRTEVLRLQRQEADTQSQITNRRNRYFQDAQAELNKVEEELAGIEQTLTQRKWQLENTTLRSPLKGVVKNIRVTTRGGVLRPGEEIMQIVPLEDALVIEAKLRPVDIAYVKPGLDASVKIDAYDSTVYGTLPGRLVYISADTLNEEARGKDEPFYRIQVQTTGRRFSGRPNEDHEIQPGMTAMIEIKTGSKTVLQYLTKPITKTLGDALGER